MLLESIITKEVFSLQLNEILTFFIVISIQTVSYLALWPDTHQWTSEIKTNTTIKYKTKELKRNLGLGRKERRREESQLTSSYF